MSTEKLVEALRELESDLRDPFDAAGDPIESQRLMERASIADRIANILLSLAAIIGSKP